MRVSMCVHMCACSQPGSRLLFCLRGGLCFLDPTSPIILPIPTIEQSPGRKVRPRHEQGNELEALPSSGSSSGPDWTQAPAAEPRPHAWLCHGQALTRSGCGFDSGEGDLRPWLGRRLWHLYSNSYRSEGLALQVPPTPTPWWLHPKVQLQRLWALDPERWEALQ